MPATPAELFERHHRALYRYLLRMTSSREQAEDLTQEVFVRVMKARDTYKEQNSERAWLFRIARNLRCDLARQHTRQGVPSALDDVGPSQGPRQLVRLSLSRAIADLADEEREAFVLAEMGGSPTRKLRWSAPRRRPCVHGFIARVWHCERRCPIRCLPTRLT